MSDTETSPTESTPKKAKKDWIKPPKSILKLVGRAVAQYQMIREGDRILLGLSGGKDSLALLVILKHLQRHSPIKFELAACTIDPEIPGFDPSPLKEWVASMEIPYFMNPKIWWLSRRAHERQFLLQLLCTPEARQALHRLPTRRL